MSGESDDSSKVSTWLKVPLKSFSAKLGTRERLAVSVGNDAACPLTEGRWEWNAPWLGAFWLNEYCETSPKGLGGKLGFVSGCRDPTLPCLAWGKFAKVESLELRR